MTLEERIRVAVAEQGLVDLTVRTAKFEKDCATPAAWQAIAKYHGREKGPWGVGVRATITAAIAAALDEGDKLHAAVNAKQSKVESIFG